MNLKELLFSLNFKQLWSLSGLAIQKPLLVFPTIRATRESLALSDQFYGQKHHKNNIANAFRHALWNILIMHYTAPKCKDLNTAKAWAKTITDWHEDFSPNKPLARAMDLHNNAYGRYFYTNHYNGKFSSTDWAHKLMDACNHARRVTAIEAMKTHKNQMVYIDGIA